MGLTATRVLLATSSGSWLITWYMFLSRPTGGSITSFKPTCGPGQGRPGGRGQGGEVYFQLVTKQQHCPQLAAHLKGDCPPALQLAAHLQNDYPAAYCLAYSWLRTCRMTTHLPTAWPTAGCAPAG